MLEVKKKEEREANEKELKSSKTMKKSRKYAEKEVFAELSIKE